MSMKSVKMIFCVMMLSMVMASCDNDEPGPSGVIAFWKPGDDFGWFNYVYNTATETGVVYDGAKYHAAFTGWYASVAVEKAQFADRMPQVSFVVDSLSWSNLPGYMTISGKNRLPKLEGGSNMTGYMVNDFEMSIEDRMLSVDTAELYIPNVNITYTINNLFKIRAVQKENYYFGNTNVVSATDGSVYNNEEPIYKLKLNTVTMTADLYIKGAKFAKMMPAMDMDFKNIPFSVDFDGFKLLEDELIPEIKDVPYPAFAIKNLSGQGVFNQGLKLEFNCMEFAVTATLEL